MNEHDEKKKKTEIIDGKEIIVVGDAKEFDEDVMKAVIPPEVIWFKGMTEDEYIFAKLPLSKKAKQELIDKHLKSQRNI